LISPFKPCLQTASSGYQGGKSRHKIVTDRPIYKLSSNENMLGASPRALAAIQQHLQDLHEYPDATDHRLRQALADFYPTLTPDHFITDNSGVGLIQLLVNAFLGEGLECIYSGPTFVPYHSFPPKLGARAVHVPLAEDDFAVNVSVILAAITDQTRLVWLCSPNNPTGTHIPKVKVDKLVDALPEHVILVYDEVYYQFATAQNYTTGLPYVEAGKRVIAINSFSKAYGLAGLRVGYAYTTPEIAHYVSQLRRPFHVHTLATEAAIAALQDQAHIERTVKMVNEGKAYLYTKLDQLGVEYWKSQANFILIRPGMPSTQFESRLHQEGIMTRPADGFGAPACVRVTVGTREANEAFIGGLQKVLLTN
ncbi:MAG: histidinol-phosphate transaminase, partial [Bacteroidota bacterium]